MWFDVDAPTCRECGSMCLKSGECVNCEAMNLPGPQGAENDGVCGAAEKSKARSIRASGSDCSTVCPACGAVMRPEHAHYRCDKCFYRDSCCY